MRWQPGMNLSGLLSACNEMLAQPLPLAWSSQTPRFLLIFTGLYAVIALAMRWQPGMNLSGLLSACNEMLAQPLPLAWSSQDRKSVV